LIKRFRGVRAIVMGDAMLDAYTHGSVGRICPEGPVPVYDVQNTRLCAGGAANTAANLAALGAQTTLLTVVGHDDEGDQVLRLLRKDHVNTQFVVRSRNRRTLAKHRLLANGQLLMRVDQGTTGPLDEADEARLMARLRDKLVGCDLLIVSDYAYGNLTPRVIEFLNERSPRVLLGVDSKNLRRFASVRPDIVKPNYAQARQLLGLPELAETPQRCESMAAFQQELLEITGARMVALTCDRDGCVCMQAGAEPIQIPAKTCNHPGVAGAGDSFLATLGLALRAGETPTAAAQLATHAAGLVVDKECTATCTASELLRCQAGMGRSWELSVLAEHLNEERRHGRRIVLTCGCFDILHHGHVEYLRRARQQGDRLVVAVNSDSSIRRLKGPERPINPLSDRLEVLAALGCVDYLLTFDDIKPDRVIEQLRPDVFVKGGDYTRATLPEADLVERLGGQVRFIPMVENRSTSRIIDRILSGTMPTSAASLS
jgi:D-beta-D-heptose 7-phosphate kinase/D-beta-D-heptose 1-phosphate adenosyltransferase